MPEASRPHRQTPEASPGHTVASDSSLRPSHSDHTNADFYPDSAELELQTGNKTRGMGKNAQTLHTL